MKETKKVDKCSVCGMCKVNCPVYSVLKSEIDSPRGKAILLKENRLDMIFYKCTLCGACVVDCPSEIDIDEEIRDARARLVLKKQTTPAVTKMIKNIKEHGNPYGKVEKGKIPKELYCC